jgi:hypothetical protein
MVVAALIAAIARWRRWAWGMPVAAWAGFLAGYALIVVPKLPPRDGTDWLFWLAIPATLLGVVDATVGRRWGWVLGLAAGVVALAIVLPLPAETVPRGSLYAAAALLALAGAGVCLAIQFAEPRVGPAAVVASLCVTLGGAAVVVLSSNLRVVGIYGIAAAAALAPAAAIVGSKLVGAGRAAGVVAVLILAGLLAGGRYYPDPGVSWTNLAVLMVAPVLVLVGVFVPAGRRAWVRGVVAVVAVIIAVGAVTVPAALSAKHAAEKPSDDPYADYK